MANCEMTLKVDLQNVEIVKEKIAALQSQLDEAREEITASRNFIEDILGHATKSQLRAIQPFHVKYRNALNGGK